MVGRGVAAEDGTNRDEGRRVADISGQQHGAGQRGRLGDIDTDDNPVTADARDGDLGPAARRAAEIDDTLAKPQQAKALVELDQLEGGARSVAEPPRFGDIGVVELARQPARRRRFAPAGAADFDRGKAANRWAAAALHIRIRSRRIPSRTPRSATRNRPTGQVAQIASRTAQPLSTRSARSWPMHGLAARPAKSRPARCSETAVICSKVSMLPSTMARM